MASRVIDTFCVRHGGPAFLHPWRYRQVLIDENGNLSSRTKPGKPGLDDPCISDYAHKDRRYKNNALITEFCNTVTHTNYRVYAQDCPPYAYVQTDINASKCGYLTPLPEPSVPPNPFGEGPPYGEYYYFDYCDIDGVPISVKIFKKSYAGVPIQVEEGGKSPVILRYTNSDNDNKFGQIRSCEAIITFNALTDFQYQKFYTDDEREYLVEVRKDDELKFKGFVIPDTAQEPFIAPPYPITIRATDGIGTLKNITYPIPIGSDINVKQTFLDIICFCLAMTNLNLDIRTTCNLYEIGMDNEIDKDPLALASVTPLRMSDDKGNIYTAYDALIAVLTLFTARLYQQDGMWNFERIGDLSGNTIRSRIYNHTGFFLYSEEIDPHRIAGKDEDIELINHSHSLRIGNAYKRVETLLKFGESPAIVFNGKFDQWDGQNFNYWTKYGGVSIDRVQKSISGYLGAVVLVNDYALKFNQSANSGKWLESNPIAVIKGSKVGITLDISQAVATLFKIRIKCGKFYLFNEPYTNNYEWVTSLATTSVQLLKSLSLSNNSANFINYTINTPEIPESGYITIQLFGVETTGFENPCYVDNVGISISQSVNDGKNEKDGNLNICEQSGFYTNSPEQIELIYGDFVQSFSIVGANLDLSNASFLFNNTVFGITTTGSTAFDNLIKTGTIQSTLNTLYAIYVNNSTLTTLWYEYGQSSEKLPIALWCAKSILKAYQKPFRYMEGDYKGTNLKYSDLISFNVPNNTPFSNRIFMVMDGEFDLKYNTLTGGSLVEIFNKNIATSDISTPHSPGDISPPIVQNPNNPSPDTINGIFTEEFTPEFL